MFTGIQPIIERDPRRADMHQAGWGRGETGNNLMSGVHNLVLPLKAV